MKLFFYQDTRYYFAAEDVFYIFMISIKLTIRDTGAIPDYDR